MPLVASVLSANIATAGLSSGLVGSDFTRIANAVAQGLSMALLTPGVSSAQLIGVSGVGAVMNVSPPIGPTPPAMSTAISASLAGVGMSGVSVPQVSLAIATGFCITMPSISAVGSCPTVSTGTGVARLIGLQPASLYSLLMTASVSNGMLGTEVPRFMDGLSKGICSFLTATFTIPVAAAGPPIPPPPVGPVPSSGVAIIQLV